MDQARNRSIARLQLTQAFEQRGRRRNRLTAHKCLQRREIRAVGRRLQVMQRLEERVARAEAS